MEDDSAPYGCPALITVTSREEACEWVAELIEDIVRGDARPDGTAVLGLATGRSPLGVYEALARMHRENDLDFSRVQTFNLDEYLGLSPDDPCSFRAAMETHLFSHVNLAPAHIHFLDGSVPEVELEVHCQSYEDAIRDAGGIDLLLLGLGPNGHIAYNEPGSSPESRTRLVKLAEETRSTSRRDFPPGREVPRHALTMGIATILEARKIHLLAFGASKAEAVRILLTETPGPEIPAEHLLGHPNLSIWLDEEAARFLE